MCPSYAIWPKHAPERGKCETACQVLGASEWVRALLQGLGYDHVVVGLKLCDFKSL